MLDAGGDFADGVIAHEGQWLGAETFVSFDRKAVEMLKAQGSGGAAAVGGAKVVWRQRVMCCATASRLEIGMLPSYYS